MPGQYLSGEEITPETSVLLERIHSNVAIVRRHGTSYRRLGFQGSDGHIRYFIVQTGQHFSNNPGACPSEMAWQGEGEGGSCSILSLFLGSNI